MDSKKKYIIIGIVVLVVIVLIYLLKNGNNEDEDKATSAYNKIAERAGRSNSEIGNSSAVVKNEEDEEYQNLLIEYADLNGDVLPAGAKSLTAAGLRARIKSLRALKTAYNEYVKVETDASKQLSADELAENYKTAEDVYALIEEVKERQLKERLTVLCNSFIENAKNNGNGGSCWKKAQAWDESVLQELLVLTDSEKKVFNTLFRELTKGGLMLYAKDCGIGGQVKCTTVFQVCNLPMNCAEGTTRGLSRTGWQMCREVRDAYRNIA